MRATVFAALFLMSTLASGRIPFLFVPGPNSGIVGIPVTAELNFYFGATQYTNGAIAEFLGVETRTITLQNDGPAMSGNISIQMQAHNGAFTITNDTCSLTILMSGGSCTFDIVFNGAVPTPNPVELDAIQDNTVDRRYIQPKLCTDCY